LQETKDNSKRMRAALFTTGPYIQMLIHKFTPMAPTVKDGVVEWRVPLGNGAVAHVDLEDCGYYVRWIFDNQDRANGMDFEVAVEMVDYSEMAKAFTKVRSIGRLAR